MKKHAKFGSPSGLYALEKCPAKIAFGKNIPELPESEYALEGTSFHNIMEDGLPLYLDGKRERIKKLLVDCPYEDMEEFVWKTLEKVQELYLKFKEKHEKVSIHYELPVQLNPDVFGTGDVVFTGTHKKTKKTNVITIDYKYGKGVPVPVKENLQGVTYLLAAVNTLDLRDVGVGRVYIAQMRLEEDWEQDYYDVKAEEFHLWETRINKIVDRAKQIFDGKIPIEGNLFAGSHCRFCKCAPVCPQNKKEHFDELQASANELPIDDILGSLTLDQQVEVFLKKSRIEDFLEANAKDLQRKFEAGLTHPLVKLIETKGRRKWKDEKTAAKGLIKLGLKDPYNKKLVGITEAEKALGKGAIDKLVELSPGKKELVSVNHKSPAIAIEGIKELPE